MSVEPGAELFEWRERKNVWVRGQVFCCNFPGCCSLKEEFFSTSVTVRPSFGSLPAS
jgi:hypothetical protein